MRIRNLLATVALAGACLTAFGSYHIASQEPKKTTYNCLTEVVCVGENDLVTAISVDGHIWEFYADGIEVGNEVDLIIEHNDTIDVCDDVVVDLIK